MFDEFIEFVPSVDFEDADAREPPMAVDDTEELEEEAEMPPTAEFPTPTLTPTPPTPTPTLPTTAVISFVTLYGAGSTGG